jgi:hypothetical protein
MDLFSQAAREPSEVVSTGWTRSHRSNHGSKPIPIGTLKNIIRGASLDAEEFR